MAQYDKGYIKLYRKIKYQDWYKKVPMRIVFEHCLLSANWEEKDVNGIIVEKGSFITSLNTLVEETGLSKKQIRLALGALEKAQMLAQEKTHLFTKISVINWDKYQSIEEIGAQLRAQEEAQERALTKEDKETKEKDRMKDRLINNKELCDILGFYTLSNRQCLVIQEEWMKYKTLNELADIVDRAKEHNPKNLFNYVHKIIMKSVPKDIPNLVEYDWWNEEEE